MTRTELARKIYEIARITGNFKLRSGQTSNEYFDKYRFESQPIMLRAIADQMAEMIPKDTDYLAALEMGGIPIGTALSLKTGLPLVFVRKKAKDYGTCKFAEGAEIKGRKLTIIEDVVTTGGQALISSADLRGDGAVVQHILCVIFRGNEQALSEFKAKNLTLHPLFTKLELEQNSK